MWYSRYEINDNSLIGMKTQRHEGQVDDGRINYHTIKILPTNANILKRGNQLNTKLNELKFEAGGYLYFQESKIGNVYRKEYSFVVVFEIKAFSIRSTYMFC